MVRAGLFPDQPKVGPRVAEDTAHREVIAPNEKALWLWNPKWRTVEERGFIEVDAASFQMDRVLVACGIVDSRTNAQRLLKSNSISWRRDENVMDWTKVTDFRQELEPGWPIVLRVGDGHWRTLQVEVEVIENPPFSAGKEVKPTVKKVTKPKAFPSLALVMRPMWVEGLEEDGVTPWRHFQTIECWSEMWRD
jgi:hypothetical protein